MAWSLLVEAKLGRGMVSCSSMPVYLSVLIKSCTCPHDSQKTQQLYVLPMQVEHVQQQLDAAEADKATLLDFVQVSVFLPMSRFYVRKRLISNNQTILQMQGSAG